MEAGFVILWVVLSAVAGSIAQGKGHSAAAYFFASVIFSPLVGIILAAAVRPDQKVLDQREIEHGRARRCPSCAELVQLAALKCKHCGADLPQIPKEPPGLFARIFGGK